MAISGVLGSMLGATSSTLIQSAFEQLEEPEDTLTFDQMLSIGVLKSHSELFGIESEVSEGICAFAEDYETLRLEGFSSQTAFEIARLIYLPRISLIESGHLSKEFVQELDTKQVTTIVENSLIDRLDSEGITPETDLVFRIGGIGGSGAVEEHLD